MDRPIGLKYSRRGSQMEIAAQRVIIVAVVVTLSVSGSCTRSRQTVLAQSTQPYSIQKDALGESLSAYQLNNPSCKPQSGSADDFPVDPIEGGENCGTAVY